MNIGDTVILKSMHKAKVLDICDHGDVPTVKIQRQGASPEHVLTSSILRVETKEDLKGECS